MDCHKHSIESMQLLLQFCYYGNGLAGPFISIYHYCQYGIFIGIGYRFLQLRLWHPFYKLKHSILTLCFLTQILSFILTKCILMHVNVYLFVTSVAKED